MCKMKNVTYINAGAGSGKTYKLTEIVATSLLDKTYMPGQIIMTTFTRDAAAEFKERVYSKLYEEQMYEEAALLETAVIGTIDSMCQQFISDYWYLLGQSPEAQILTDSDFTYYQNQSLADIVTEEDQIFFNDYYEQIQPSKYGESKNDTNNDFWKNDLGKIIDLITTNHVKSLDECKDESLDLLKKVYQFNNSEVDFALLKKTLEEAIKADNNTGGESAAKTDRKNKMDDWIININAGKLTIAELFAIIKFFEKLPKKVSGKIESIEEALKSLNNIYHCKLLESYLTAYTTKIFELATEWFDTYQKYKKEHRLLRYSDLESQFLALLQREEFVSEMRKRFRVIFVDEFQDCNPIQIKIFNKLSEILEKSYWVGDPKQSIYAFRGTDMEAVAQITSSIPTEKDENRNEKQYLSNSYRSLPSLVCASNTIFTKVFSGDTIREKDIVLNTNQRAGEEQPGFDSLIHWHLIERGYNALAWKIKQLIDSGLKISDKENKLPRHIKCSDIAILSKSNNASAEIAESLRILGLPVNLDEPLKEKREIKLLFSVLSLIANRTDDLAKSIILTLTEKGYTLSRLIEDRVKFTQSRKNQEESGTWLDETTNPLLKTIDERRAFYNSLSVSGLIEIAVIELNLREYIGQMGNSQTRANNLERIVSEAHIYEQHCDQLGIGSTISGFLSYFNIKDESKSDNKKGLPTGDGITLCTYHGAKGLEWPIVILNDLDKCKDVIKSSFFGVNLLRESADYNSESLIYLTPPVVFGQTSIPEVYSTSIKETEQYRRIEQIDVNNNKNLLYVGFTRARDILITTSRQKNEMEWIKAVGLNPAVPSDCNATQIDLFGCDVSYPFFNVADLDIINVSELSNTKEYILDIREREAIEHSPLFVQPSTVSYDKIYSVVLKKDFQHTITIQPAYKSDSIGHCLHDIFCIYNKDSDIDSIVSSLVEGYGLKETFISHNEIITSIKNLHQYLETSYGAATCTYRELPFQHIKDGQIIRGNIDLLWEVPNGVVLIDYKTGESSAEKYGSQIDCYKEALTAAGKTVIESLIYNAVKGHVIELQ